MPFASKGTRGDRVLVEPISPVLWRLEEEVRYIGDVDEFIVPAGYVTDFATVPRIAVWLIARFGSYTKAAILHDFLLTHCVESGRVSSVDADGLFLRALRELRVPAYRRLLMWTGVRWAALFSKTRRPGWLRTFPKMMLGTIAFLCSVLPPLAMIVVAAAVIVHNIIELAWSRVIDGKTEAGSLSV
jgi:hypothetical protein